MRVNMSNESNELDQYLSEGIEDDKVEDVILIPFNPADVDIVTKTEVIGQVVDRVARGYKKDTSGAISLAPDFQRKNDLWKIDKKSQLIESILLGIPLPMFYVATRSGGDWDVVDGIQRLGVLRDFVLGKKYLSSLSKKEDYALKGQGFKLSGLEFLTQFEDLTFVELPGKQQDDILGCNIQVTVIRAGTPDTVKFNIFKRINTGGLPLTNQEIRHALHQGSATKFLQKLVELPIFNKATAGSIKDERMEGRELILRLFASLLFGHEFKESRIDIDNILNNTMLVLNKIGGTPEIYKDELPVYKHYSFDELESMFVRSMERNYILFGTYAFRKSLPKERRTPINKALFETWGVTLGLLSETKWEKLLNNKRYFLERYGNVLYDYDLNGFIQYASEEFLYAVGEYSYLNASIRLRYKLLEDLIDTSY